MDNRIHVLREAQGLTLEALAKKIGTTNQQISLLENGQRRLTVEWLYRLSKSLKCHPWEVIDDDAPEPLGVKDVQLLRRFRQLTALQQDALLRLLNALPPSHRRRSKSPATR
jgi:transcriptional regulator with XRE-family HTH domain